MAEVPSTAVGLSPKPATPTIDLSNMEEGKGSSSPQASMEDVSVSPTNIHKMLAEFIGTYLLILLGCGSALADQIQQITLVGIAVVWGLLVMVLIYSLGHVSGAHFNPAITIAFASSRKFPWKHVPMYIVVQLLGSILATLTLLALYDGRVKIKVTVTQFSDPTNVLQALVWEFIISFVLMFTVCGVAIDNRAINELSGVAVGATILMNVLVAGPITGASMNPARSIGPAIVSRNYNNLWVYIVAPILGAMAAPLTYSFLQLPMPDKSNKENTTKSV